MNAIYDLLNEQQLVGGLSPEYIEKMMHLVPEVDVVKRERFLLERAKDKKVLDIGCTGKLSKAIWKVAKEYQGIDKKEPENSGFNFMKFDLDLENNWYPFRDWADIIIASEVIEHLSNAGRFLDWLREHNAPIVLTAPNAYRAGAGKYAANGIDCVNGEHVAHYSYWTLKTLVERHGFTITEWYWYNGNPGTAEGLIFCLE